nr:MAG TPA: hypothetical protein [Caudoviricetes sp.]
MIARSSSYIFTVSSYVAISLIILDSYLKYCTFSLHVYL